MAYGTTPVTATIPDGSSTAQVYGDAAGGGVIQGVKQIDPTPGSTTPIGTAANPEHVRPRRRGTLDYDSGVFAVQVGDPAQVTAATIYPEDAVLINDSDEPRQVRWTNSADALLGVLVVQPKSTVPMPAAGAWVGLKIGASGDNVRAHVAGAQ